MPIWEATFILQSESKARFFLQSEFDHFNLPEINSTFFFQGRQLVLCDELENGPLYPKVSSAEDLFGS